MLRWIITHFDLDNDDELLVKVALVTGGANVFAAGDELCPEALMMRLHRQQPGHFNDPDRPLCARSNGLVLSGDVIAALFRLAAVAFDLPPESVGVLSLPAGGASWQEAPALSSQRCHLQSKNTNPGLSSEKHRS